MIVEKARPLFIAFSQVELDVKLLTKNMCFSGGAQACVLLTTNFLFSCKG